MAPPEVETLGLESDATQPRSLKSLHAAINASSTDPQYISIEDIKNATIDNKRLIIVYKEGVYDVTKWASDHPGGSVILESMNGSDCTDIMSILHPQFIVERYLPKLFLGKLDQPISSSRTASKDSLASTSSESSTASNRNYIHSSKSPISISFRKLHKRIMRDGLFDIDMGFYYREIVKVLVVLASSICILICSPTRLANQIISAILMAFFWQQLAFIAHDAGMYNTT